MSALFLVTCANESRLPQLWATLSSLLTGLTVDWEKRVNTVKVIVVFNKDSFDTLNKPNSSNGGRTWEVLFRSVGIEYSQYVFDEQLSPPQMWCEVLKSRPKDEWFISVDDDMIWVRPNLLVDFLSSDVKYYNPDLITYGFWDIENKRQYFDWYDSFLVSKVNILLEKHGERAVWNQKWELDAPVQVFAYDSSTVICTGASVVKVRSVLDNPKLWTKLSNWSKGTRGYDYYLCNNIGSRRFHFFPTYVNHVGVYRPQLDNDLWTAMESDESNHIQSNLPYDKI